MMRYMPMLLTIFVVVVYGFDSDEGIDELEAVIELDKEDDFFKMLTEHDSTCVHLYSRKDANFLNRRKAFRAAAKQDIDKARADGLSRRETTQWIAINKDVMIGQTSSSTNRAVVEDEIDEEQLMQMFGVHQPLTFYGHMNMKMSIEFPINANGKHVVEDAAAAILIEKNKRIQRLLPSLTCDKFKVWLQEAVEKPTVVIFGAAQLTKSDNDAKLGFLRQV